MSDKLYLVDGDGLIRMRPSAPPDEDRLQELIAAHTDLIGTDESDLLLVRREQSVASAPDGAGR